MKLEDTIRGDSFNNAAINQHHVPPRTRIRTAIVVYHYKGREYVRLKSIRERSLAMIDRETCNELVVEDGSLRPDLLLARLLAEKRMRRTFCFRTDVGGTAALARNGLLESLAIRTPVLSGSRRQLPRSGRRAPSR